MPTYAKKMHMVMIYMYMLFFDLLPVVVSDSEIDSRRVAFEEARIVSEEMLKDDLDIEGGVLDSDAGNSTVANPRDVHTEAGDEDPPEYDDTDPGTEPENSKEPSEESDGGKNDVDRGEDITIKEEVMRRGEDPTKTREDTKVTHQQPPSQPEKKEHPSLGGSQPQSKNNLPSCADEQIIRLMKELHVMNPEGAVVRAVESENGRLCRKLSSGLSTVEHFIATCDLSKDEKSYANLIQGVQALHSKLCEEEVFRTEYLKNQACYRNVGEDYKDCVGPTGWSEGLKQDYVCSEYVKVANCFYIKTAVRCAIPEARTMKDLMKYVVGRVLAVQCTGIEKEPEITGLMRAKAYRVFFSLNFEQAVISTMIIFMTFN